MAHLRFFNPSNSKFIGSIKRAQQLIRSQYVYLEDHPERAPKTYRRLRSIALRLDELKQAHPKRINQIELQQILNELSSIVGNLQHAA